MYYFSVVAGLLIGAILSWTLHTEPPPEAPPSPSQPPPATESTSSTKIQNDPLHESPKSLTAANLETRLQFALSFESQNRRAWELELLFRDLSKENAPAIYQQLIATLDIQSSKEVLGPFWESWGNVDGKAAYAIAATLAGEKKSTALKYILPSWAKRDALAVWSIYVDSLQQQSGLDFDTTNVIFYEAAKVSPDMVFSFASETNSPGQDLALMSALMKAAAESNQLAYLAGQIDQFSTPGKRDQWAADFYRYWAMTQSDEALAKIETIEDPDLAKVALKGYLAGLYFADPVKGLDTLFSMKDNPAARNALTEQMPMILARSSRAEKQAFIDKLEQEQMLDLFTSNINLTASWVDPALALEIAENLEGAERTSLIQKSLSNWVHKDFDSAIAYYYQLPSNEDKVRFAPIFTDQLSRHSDGGANLTTILGNLPPGAQRTAIVENLLARTKGARSASSVDFLLALELIAKSEPNLSAEAIATRDALFQKQADQ